MAPTMAVRMQRMMVSRMTAQGRKLRFDVGWGAEAAGEGSGACGCVTVA